MRLTYSPDIDAGYLYLTDPWESQNVARTVPLDPFEAGGQIHVDFDYDGKMIGIEILNLSHMVRESTLKEFAKASDKQTRQ